MPLAARCWKGSVGVGHGSLSPLDAACNMNCIHDCSVFCVCIYCCSFNVSLHRLSGALNLVVHVTIIMKVYSSSLLLLLHVLITPPPSAPPVQCEVCEEGCSKPRPPGCPHTCSRPCHLGDCPTCRQMIRQRCHCKISLLYVECT